MNKSTSPTISERHIYGEGHHHHHHHLLVTKVFTKDRNYLFKDLYPAFSLLIWEELNISFQQNKIKYLKKQFINKFRNNSSDQTISEGNRNHSTAQ